jgi:thymidylate synthase (FAD)
MIEIDPVPRSNLELMIVNAARVSLSKHSTSLSADDKRLIRFLYAQCHWTPLAHPHVAIIMHDAATWRWRTPEHVVPVTQPASGSAHAYDGNATIVNGSLWYWLENYKEYTWRAPLIKSIIARNCPTVAAVAGLSDTQSSGLVQQFDVTDHWVSKDVENRAALAMMTFRVKAPLPIRAQCFKHKIGFVENEVSRRYVTAPPDFHMPDTWRRRAPGVKQGSLPEPVPCHWAANALAKLAYGASNVAYRAMLKLGACPEQARFLLSQGMETEWYWTMSLADFYRAYRLRVARDAQEETCNLFKEAASAWSRRWTQSWALMSRP